MDATSAVRTGGTSVAVTTGAGTGVMSVVGLGAELRSGMSVVVRAVGSGLMSGRTAVVGSGGTIGLRTVVGSGGMSGLGRVVGIGGMSGRGTSVGSVGIRADAVLLGTRGGADLLGLGGLHAVSVGLFGVMSGVGTLGDVPGLVTRVGVRGDVMSGVGRGMIGRVGSGGRNVRRGSGLGATTRRFRRGSRGLSSIVG